MFTQKEFDKLNKQFWKLKTQEEKIAFWRKYEIDKNNPHFLNEKKWFVDRLNRFSYSPDSINKSRTDKTKYMALLEEPFIKDDSELYNQYRIEQIREMDKTISLDYLISDFYSNKPLNVEEYRIEKIKDLEKEMKGAESTVAGYMRKVYYGESISFFPDAITQLHYYCIGYEKARFLHYLKTGEQGTDQLTSRQIILLLSYMKFFETEFFIEIPSQESKNKFLGTLLNVHYKRVQTVFNQSIKLKPKSNSKFQMSEELKDLNKILVAVQDIGLKEVEDKIKLDIETHYKNVM